MKWFKHDSTANTDARLKKVRHKYGITGYGLYWYCLELIAGTISKDNITFQLEEDAETIALEWGIDQLKVQEIMSFFVKLGLFEHENGRISCLKLAKRLDDTNSKNPEIRKILEKVNENKGLSCSEKLRETPKSFCQNRLDKNRLDKNNNKNTMSTNADTEKRKLVIEIFEHWLSAMSKTAATKLTSKRNRAIQNRLKEGYTVEQIKTAIDNCSRDKFSMGENDRGRPFNDIELICRSGEKIEFFLEQKTAVKEVDWTAGLEWENV